MENWFIPDVQVESGRAGSELGAAAVEEGISPHRHGCCPTARHKTLPGELSMLAGIPFPCSQMKISPFPSLVRLFFHSSIQLAGSWDQKGTHTARGAAGGVGGR